MNGVYIGDQGVENDLIENLSAFNDRNILSIRVKSSVLQSGIYDLRPDVSRDVYRLQHTRVTTQVKPQNTVERYLGSITMDNDAYGRYRGEVQICRRDLEANHRVNVIGLVIEEDLPLLALLESGQSVNLQCEELYI